MNKSVWYRMTALVFVSMMFIAFDIALLTQLTRSAEGIVLPARSQSDITGQIEKTVQSSDQRDQLFTLSIAKIGLEVPITENVNGKHKAAYEQPLNRGLGHYEGTSLPGEGGNIFLFGHAADGSVPSSYYAAKFSRISELSPGDEITLVKNGESFTYKVIEKQFVGETNLSVLEPTSQEVVTLMTCLPHDDEGKRLIVRATLI